MHEDKKRLREIMHTKRKCIAYASKIKQDNQLFNNLLQLPSVLKSNTLLLTLSFESECDTWRFANWVIKTKGYVVLPRVDNASHTLKLYRVFDLDRQIEKGFKGIFEPKEECEPELYTSIDWILVPGLAFDLYGGRLGYGGGYFDRLLPQLSDNVYRVGMGYRFQLVDYVPMEEFDQRVQVLVFPSFVHQVYGLF
jgi:5-formyltetrahydrofolate cyclo-ligase